MLTKSDYIRYLQCLKLGWLNKKRPDLISQEIRDSFVDIMEEGYEVEKYAYQLFPDGKTAKDESSTKKLMKEGGVIFQPTIVSGELYCRADIIAFDENNKAWDIFEVKSSTQEKAIHEYDLSFQKLCFEEAGHKVGKLNLIHINNEYVKNGEIDVKELFKVEDITEEVNELAQETKEGVAKLSEILKKEAEPNVRPVKQCNNPYGCMFKDYCLRDLPEKSIYSIIGKLSEKTVNKLLDEGIVKIEDIPPELITPSFKKHFHAIKHNEVHIEKEGIKSELGKIEYPIYFLDYETYGSAIPIFDGYRPYQNIVFQYSLHIQKSADSGLEHFAFLADKWADPTKEMAESLQKLIGKEGTVIAWNMGFEQGCNEDMGGRDNRYKEFFEDINNRMYDLMSVFKQGFYIHKDFYGSASLKKVLPVLVPSLSYGALNIHEGMTASNSWYEMIDSKTSKKRKQEIYDDLLKYCELDTLAMVEILKELRKIKID
jgi:hypothetical protein